ncbi:MAG TPA: SIMPL domain-containing protein, partial [Longimicrobiales bacterium]
ILEYYYSDIARIKHNLLGAATRDARARADEIAKSAGSEVGQIIAARSGVFQITEPYSTEVSGMGMYNTGTRRKEITVTVRADFALR